MDTHTTSTSMSPHSQNLLNLLPGPAVLPATWHCRTAASCTGTFKLAAADALSARIKKRNGRLKISQCVNRALFKDFDIFINFSGFFSLPFPSYSCMKNIVPYYLQFK